MSDFFNSDMQLFLDGRVDWPRITRLRRGADVDAAEELAVYKMMLESAGQVCADLEEPAALGWSEEVTLRDGVVIKPAHIVDGYERFREAGLLSIAIDPAYGGAGVPALPSTMLIEMIARVDASLMTIIGLQGGVAIDIERYGSEELKQEYLPRFVSGELQGSMDLTEPNAGSDLGSIRTRVTEQDGRFHVDGQKIFITNGGAEVHLVLARAAESYEQSLGTTNGLSLMLCPTVTRDGQPNGVSVSKIESKLGLHGSPTCVVDFDHAEAYLLGTSGDGFRAMLDLMNNARLGVAAQAIGVAEASYRAARAYAAERVQFGSPIINQPLVKSMLTLMAVNVQSARALLYRTCALVDRRDALRRYLDRGDSGAGEPAELEREFEEVNRLVRFFTPLCKYFATEISNDVARVGIQVHGGLGYMAESRAGHYHSDSIITTIYEGTSEIQASFALKEIGKGALLTVIEGLRAELKAMEDEERRPVAERVVDGIEWIEKSFGALVEDPQYALLSAKRVCQMSIDVISATELLCQAELHDDKLMLAQTFVNRHMINVEGHARRIASGDATRITRYDRILKL
jgi:alkylation response protein AidB-like acyl-CoA dehydrogenase